MTSISNIFAQLEHELKEILLEIDLLRYQQVLTLLRNAQIEISMVGANPPSQIVNNINVAPYGYPSAPAIHQKISDEHSGKPGPCFCKKSFSFWIKNCIIKVLIEVSILRMSYKRLLYEGALNDLNQAITTQFLSHNVAPIVITKIRSLILEHQHEWRIFN